ncbi:glycosyltransferase family 2 protein [Neobacillus massiliamazoniensis]|jgi:glycosyltransferase involved in cell wall biosynthesis|uniref:Glycosyl transferase family protein n=1 Tax=Neobacillus massiliamazoniensis TaxID=1499688 RepID=A0A0U1P3M5_9BACI|nr:glycosyltransferase family 2 protein [Neobacillus massiliamazoniensis]CRK84909.1 glycosyl transferase family protein [Neobacillus massiliamazoniensis]
MKILAIIPAFNEQDGLKKVAAQFKDIDYVDVLVINDCSKDNTSEIGRILGFNVVDLPCNLGIGGAVQTGYKYAWENGYDIAIQVDGDGQHNPSYIKDLIIPIKEGKADLVIGSRYLKKEGFQSSFMRRVGIFYFSFLINLFEKKKITDPTSGFRACNRKIIEHFSKRYPHDYPEPESIAYLLRNNFNIEEVAVIMNERFGGASSITSFKSVYYMIKVSLAIFIDNLRKIGLT